LKNYS